MLKAIKITKDKTIEQLQNVMKVSDEDAETFIAEERYIILNDDHPGNWACITHDMFHQIYTFKGEAQPNAFVEVTIRPKNERVPELRFYNPRV